MTNEGVVFVATDQEYHTQGSQGTRPRRRSPVAVVRERGLHYRRALQAAHGGSGGRPPVHRSRSHGRPAHPCGGVGAGSRGPPAEAHHPHQTSIQAARRQDMGHLRARQGAGGAQTAARRAGRWELRRERRQCPGFRTARHRQDPRLVCHRPPAG